MTPLERAREVVAPVRDLLLPTPHELGLAVSLTLVRVAAAITQAEEQARDEEREACAMLHEQIHADCDRDRIKIKLPCGCGAMGAVIEYRDAIRARGSKPPSSEKEPGR